ncbi:rRNA maturation RNase YbeY [Algicella marina]|uniref:Endoribonuclease YbeY n=1 Tax=Algicella marina TaxID=2683284 RepID=A0A6P1T3B0_9RHOB|nr:rRNA maturation RNase YbeY [Algicella marina]QHQ36163.1 rRNA maturation RNase YbeY [Algicella marina]
MTPEVDLIIEDERWRSLPLQSISQDAVGLALAVATIKVPVEVSLLATNDEGIAELNSRFRGKSKATNVLSWPAFELFASDPGGQPTREIPSDPFGLPAIGDIALAFETVMAESQSGGIRVEDHILHLVLHGSLHLLGYDHENEADATLMESLEVRALASRGIATPY